MPAKIARSAPRPPFELPKVMVAVRTSPLSCWKAGKTRIFTPVRESILEKSGLISLDFPLSTRSQPRTPRSGQRRGNTRFAPKTAFAIGLRGGRAAGVP